ncbi:MAG TPA: type II secretion system F family protein [Candidatus Sulfotelmatobacter sp.]|jgi:tight adherence protein C|nr:type II secretion system F family protein [Candidatus Sulfotelmatobacter sp.]
MPNLTTMIVMLSALGAFVSVLAVGLQLLQRDQLNERLKMVAERRRELSARQREALQGKGSRFQLQRHVGLMKSMLDRLRMQNLLENKEMKAKLAQAGWRRPSAAVAFVFARVALPLVMVGLGMLYLSANPIFAAWPLQLRLLAALACGLFGTMLPNILLTNTIQKRQKALSRSFPDALDLMVICVEAGLSIEGAFQRVVEEMSATAPVLAEEIALTSAELAFLSERKAAYENFSDRTGLPAIKSLCTALAQSERYGTPVSVALRVLSHENREARMSAAEKKAAALPAKLTVPMIVFFLPVLFMVIIGPAGIRVAEIMGK